MRPRPIRSLACSAALTLALGLATPATAEAAPAPAAAQAIPRIPFTRYVLPNGLTLVVHEDHKAPIVAVNVWYHVGSKNERPGKTGFAHLFEHLMFNGSENFNDDWFKVLERIGATDLNGTTNEDRTNYFQNVPVSALDTVLWMESDRMGHLVGAIDQPRLDEQRGVVKNEKRQGENQPYGLLDVLLPPALYPAGHPYSWSVIGSMEDLDAASLEDVKTWFKTYYGAANATLVVAGDVKPEDVKARVERYFGDIPAGPPVARHREWIAKRTGESRQELEDRVPQARVYLAWNTPGFNAADDDRLDLAARVLSSGKSSRLYKRLVYDERIATDVRAFQSTSEIAGQFLVEATARQGVAIEQVERAVREELARFLAGGPTPDELQRVKTGKLAEFVRGVERIGGFGGKSDVLAQYQVYAGDAGLYEQRLKEALAATPAQVHSAAKAWLSDGVHVATVRPFGEHAVAAAGADRKVRPEPGPSAAPRFPAFERARLPNGLQVIVAERRGLPVVQLDLVLDAGFSSDSASTAGLARLAAGMLAEGTKTRGALAISEEVQRLGATLDARANLDQTLVQMTALKPNLDASLALLADVVLSPTFPAADFDRRRALQLAAIDQESAEPNAMAFRVLPRLLYGEGHAYANPLSGSGTRATLAKLTREDAVAWHARWVKPNNAVLVVSGDTRAAEILPKLERLFAGWRPGEVPKKNLAAVAPPPKPRVFVLDRPGAIQSVIVAGDVVEPRANPQEIAQAAMNTVLGGAFTSRVNMNLREDKHWSYGARTSLVDARGPRPFLAVAPVQADKTKESVQEILKELRGIRGEKPPTEAELATAKGALALRLPGRFETVRAVSGAIAEVVRFGFDDRYYDSYAARVNALVPADLAAAARMVDVDRLTWVIVGDRAKLEPELKGLGVGEVTAIDPDGNVLGASAAR